MRAPKVTLWFIVFGLPVLFLAQFFVLNKAWAGVYTVQQHRPSPEIKQTRAKRIVSTASDKVDICLGPGQTSLESQIAKPDTKVVSKETSSNLYLSQPGIYSICSQYIIRLKTQSADYQRRACDLSQLLIFPYHWFW